METLFVELSGDQFKLYVLISSCSMSHMYRDTHSTTSDLHCFIELARFVIQLFLEQERSREETALRICPIVKTYQLSIDLSMNYMKWRINCERRGFNEYKDCPCLILTRNYNDWAINEWQSRYLEYISVILHDIDLVSFSKDAPRNAI